MKMTTEMWSYTTESGVDPANRMDLTGFNVEAVDGSIGKIDEATYDTGSSQIVVDTGPWIFGKKVVLPAGVIQRIDANDEAVFVNRTKDQIKDSPKFGDEPTTSPDREAIGSYYGRGGAGYRD
jgi:hypothetical protein